MYVSILFASSWLALLGNSTWHGKNWLPVSALACLVGIIVPNVGFELDSPSQYVALMILYPMTILWIAWVAYEEVRVWHSPLLGILARAQPNTACPFGVCTLLSKLDREFQP